MDASLIDLDVELMKVRDPRSRSYMLEAIRAYRAPYAMFRFYGPEDAFYDKSFKLADVELVE